MIVYLLFSQNRFQYLTTTMFNNQFQKQNLLGSFYTNANILFDNNQVYSCVHNLVKHTDLVKNKSEILPFETTCQIKIICVSPNGVIMVAIDMAGRAVVFNLKGRFIIAQYNFKALVSIAKFSSDGQLFAVGYDNGFTVYQCPSSWRTFQPFVLIKKYKTRHSDQICSMTFTPDSRFIITAGKDHMIYVTNLFTIPNYVPITFEVHRSKIIGIECSEDIKCIYTFDEGSNIYVWKWVDDELTDAYKNRMEIKKKKMARNRGQSLQQFNEKQSKIDTSQFSDFQKRITQGRFILKTKLSVSQQNNYLKRYFYNTRNGFLATAYSHGKFAIYKLQDEEISQVQTYSLGSNKISTIAVNPNCTWIGLGVKNQAQLIVWQWKSQSYIFNQSGFTYETKSLAHNGVNSLITGTTSGKVKVWDQKTGFCVATFEQHESSVTALKFSNQFTAFSASLDGSVIGYDVIRYKKFRKFRPDHSCQLHCLTTDPNGDIVFAGSFEPYQIYSWNIQTGNLIQIISGHTGPINTLQFCGQHLLSGSWDRDLRIHDIFSRKVNVETLDHNSQITCIAVDQNQSKVAVSTMRGQIYIWEPKDGQLVAIINCQFQGGKSYLTNNHKHNNYLTCIAFSPCGKFLLGGGKSKYVMIYDISHRMLYRKISITENRDFQGVLQKLNSRFIKDGVSTYALQLSKQNGEGEEKNNDYIPGSMVKELQQVRNAIHVEIRNIKFMSNTTLAIQTSFGVLLCSSVLTNKQHFNPYELSMNINIKLLPILLKEKQFASALTLAAQLNLNISKILVKIPYTEANKVSSELNKDIAQKILQNIARQQMGLRQIVWAQAILSQGAQKIPISLRNNIEAFSSQVKVMKRSMSILEMSQIGLE